MHDEKEEGHHHHEHEDDHGAVDVLKKLEILLRHWVEHNTSHPQNYLDWAHKAGLAQKEAVVQELKSATELTERISQYFRKTKELL